MDRAAYTQMSEDEATHWWFVARRRILASLIERQAGLKHGATILEAGCGTGGNLALLSKYGRLSAFEYDAEARAIATAKSGLDISFGALPDEVPFEDGAFDLVALFDVLEHIDQDTPSLAALSKKLRRDGRILITVPAMPWLWSRHDEIHHHKRRYTRSSLTRAIEAAGLQVERLNYFNTLLFPLAVAQRFTQMIKPAGNDAHTHPGAVLNSIFEKTFETERYFVDSLPMPFGLSLYAFARRAA